MDLKKKTKNVGKLRQVNKLRLINNMQIKNYSQLSQLKHKNFIQIFILR